MQRPTEQLAQGERIREVLKQPQYKPMAVEYQVIIIYAATRKYLLDIPTAQVLDFQDGLFRFIDTKYPEDPARNPGKEGNHSGIR